MNPTAPTSNSNLSKKATTIFKVYEDFINKYSDIFEFDKYESGNIIAVAFSAKDGMNARKFFPKGSDEANNFDTINGYFPDHDENDLTRTLGVVIEVPAECKDFLSIGGKCYYAAGKDLNTALAHNPLGVGSNKAIWDNASGDDKKYIVTYIKCADKVDGGWKLSDAQLKSLTVKFKDDSGSFLADDCKIGIGTYYENGGTKNMAEISFNRLMDSGTFYLDSTTATAVKSNIDSIIGKAVTFAGNNEVGYGAADKPLAGIVTKAEMEENGSEKVVVTVEWRGTFENIAATGLAAGDGVTVDGTGGLKKSTTGLIRGVCISFNSSTATILM